MSIVSQTIRQSSGTGFNEQWGTFAFSTTDASGKLKLNMRRVESVQITPLGVVASDEVVSGPAIVAGKDGLVVPDTGVDVQRTGASKTSGLVCSYLARGV